MSKDPSSGKLPTAVWHRARFVPSLVFFGLVYWFLWKVVDTRLLYHGGGEIQVFPVFRWEYIFFQDFLRYPGGLAKYVSALLAQYYYYAWCGALVLTIQAWLLYSSAKIYMCAVQAERLGWLCFGLPLLIVALHAGYTYCFTAATNLLLGLALACLYARCGDAKAWVRYLTVLVMGTLLYAIAASGFVVFGFLVALYALHQRCWRECLLVILLLSLLPWIEGRILFGLSSGEVLGGLRPFVWTVDTIQQRDLLLVYGLYLFMPVLIVSLMLWGGARNQFLKRRHSKAHPQKAKKVHLNVPPKSPADGTRVSGFNAGITPNPLGLIAGTICILLAAGLVMHFALDRRLRAILAVDFYATQAMWPQVLQAARGNPENVYILNTVNRALYHTGDLKAKLPLSQSPAHLLLLDNDVRAHWNKADLYLDLGSVNMALHHLTEALAFYGERPYLLRRLAVANLALGNLDTARVELRSLSHTPCHRAWAEDYLRHIDADPTLSRDEEVTRLRRLMPRQDDLVPMPPELMLKDLLKANSDNRMAREYLVSYLLLEKDLKSLAENLGQPNLPGVTNQSGLYDEAALIIWKGAPKDASLVLPLPSAETQQRFQRFSALAKDAGRKALSSYPPILREFGDSYFLYYFSNP